MKSLLRIVAAAALSLIAGSAIAADTVKVGVIANFTGGMAVYGSQFQQAIQAYQAVHGKSVTGPKGETINIEFIYRDAGTTGPDKAKQLAEELVLRDHVNFFAGFDLTPHAMAVAEVATQAKVPTIIMNAATGSVTRASPYFVRLSMTVPQYAAPIAKWAYKNNIRKVFTIVSDYAPGYDAETYFSKTFKEQGGEIVGSARSPINETNFSVYMEKVLQAKPDALYMMQPGGATAAALLNSYVERGLKSAGILLMGTGETQAVYLQGASDDMIGTITSFPYTETNKTPQNEQLKSQLVKMFGEKAIPDIASAAAWDGTDLIYKSVAAVGAGAEGLKYVDFMKGQKLDSPRGPIMIDPIERDVIQNIYVRKVEKVDGKLVNIDIETTPMVKDPWKLENPPKGN
ncbi:MAG: ABC transporter substrate-binding protein [Xanthobacteraceae bacterium]